MENKRINYSFIIPHKNCPDLLQRCVDSIPERDDVQIIVVDDNSDDGKKPLLRERKNLQVILLDAIQSKGAGRARNVGLKQAEGKWLLFADADDAFTNNLTSFLDFYVENENVDMVIINAYGIEKDGREIYLRQQMYFDNWRTKHWYAEKVLRYEMWTPWSRMVRKSFVKRHNIRFEEVPIGNDIVFGLLCSKFSRNIDVYDKHVYNYYLPVNRSLTDSYRRCFTNIGIVIDHYIFRYKIYKEVGYIFKPSHLFYLMTFKANGDKLDFAKEYLKALKGRKYNLLKDVLYMLLHIVGKTMRII